MPAHAKADGGKRGNRKQQRGETFNGGKKVLQEPEAATVPDMPNATEFLTTPAYEEDPDSEPVDWSPVVKAWWRDIWTSPMSQEFVIPADLHGLYLGCYYLQRSLDPELKTSDQTAMSKSFESVQKQYGLTPQARNTLKWQVAQGETAQKRTDRMRSDVKAQQTTSEHNKDVIDLYRRNAN